MDLLGIAFRTQGQIYRPKDTRIPNAQMPRFIHNPDYPGHNYFQHMLRLHHECLSQSEMQPIEVLPTDTDLNPLYLLRAWVNANKSGIPFPRSIKKDLLTQGFKVKSTAGQCIRQEAWAMVQADPKICLGL